jgi:excisionase family DNA binding protein
MNGLTNITAPEPLQRRAPIGNFPRRAYRVRELVEILGLPKSTIHDLIHRGDIRVAALGSGRRRILLIPVEEVDRLLRDGNRPQNS